MKKQGQSRRDFISDIALGALGTEGASSILASCAGTGAFERAEKGRPAQ